MSGLRGTIRSIALRAAWSSWPAVSRIIAAIDDSLPVDGAVRRAFEEQVFWRYWRRWYRLAYVPEYRDRFFTHILRFLYRYPVRKGDVIIQVGASFGEETRRFAEAVGPTGRVVAVEPEPANLQRLTAAFAANAFPQVSIVPVGAWKEAGRLVFYVGGEREHRIADLGAGELTYKWWETEDHLNPARYRDQQTFTVKTLDDIIETAALKRVDFVLVESNGAELEVVQGLSKALPVVARIAARGHVRRDGAPIHELISATLRAHGWSTTLTSEEMVLGRRPGIRS